MQFFYFPMLNKKKNLHSQYPKLKKFGVFENSGHVTYLQIYEFTIYEFTMS